MPMKTDPTLEDALDGLMNAATYADDIGEEGLCYGISSLYQELGRLAPDDDWDGHEREVTVEARARLVVVESGGAEARRVAASRMRTALDDIEGIQPGSSIGTSGGARVDE